MNDLVQPQLGQRIADPACGTAGFLCLSIHFDRLGQKRKSSRFQPDEDGFMRHGSTTLKRKSKTHCRRLFGYDIDD
jgi:type I restriction enzyme M protein